MIQLRYFASLRERLRGNLQCRAGAMVSFTGLVRDLNEGADITGMTLEHYPGMPEKALAAIAAVIIHRIGPLAPTRTDHYSSTRPATVH